MSDVTHDVTLFSDMFTGNPYIGPDDYLLKRMTPDKDAAELKLREFCAANGEGFDLCVSFRFDFYGFVRMSEEGQALYQQALDDTANMPDKESRLAALEKMRSDYAVYEAELQTFRTMAERLLQGAQADLDRLGTTLFGEAYMGRQDVPAAQKPSAFLID